MKTVQLACLVAMMCSASVISAAGIGTPQDETPASTASPSLLDRAKSWLAPSTPTAPAQKEEAPAPVKSTDATSVNRIGVVSAQSAQVFDPTCSNLVQPFGTRDSLLSLSTLIVELKLEEFTSSSSTASLSPESVKKLRMAATNLNWLPTDAERALGRRMHEQHAEPLVDADESDESAKMVSDAKALLALMVAQINMPTPYEFEIYVRQKSGNAQALPGGIIYLDEDLLTKKKLADKARFALAHELSHVLQRHETHATQARLTDGIDSVKEMTQMLGGGVAKPANLVTYSNRVMTRFVRYSEDQELQADACAVRLLSSAFKDKAELAQIIRSFKNGLSKPVPAEPGAAPNQMEVFVGNVEKMGKLDNQHPNTKDRAANLERMLVEVNKSVPQKPTTGVKVKKAS